MTVGINELPPEGMQLGGVALAGDAERGTRTTEGLSLLFTTAGITVQGPQPQIERLLVWSGLDSATCGEKIVLPDGRDAAVMELTSGGQSIRFLLPADAVTPGQAAYLDQALPAWLTRYKGLTPDDVSAGGAGAPPPEPSAEPAFDAAIGGPTAPAPPGGPAPATTDRPDRTAAVAAAGVAAAGVAAAGAAGFNGAPDAARPPATGPSTPPASSPLPPPPPPPTTPTPAPPAPTPPPWASQPSPPSASSPSTAAPTPGPARARRHRPPSRHRRRRRRPRSRRSHHPRPPPCRRRHPPSQRRRHPPRPPPRRRHRPRRHLRRRPILPNPRREPRPVDTFRRRRLRSRSPPGTCSPRSQGNRRRACPALRNRLPPRGSSRPRRRGGGARPDHRPVPDPSRRQGSWRPNPRPGRPSARFRSHRPRCRHHRRTARSGPRGGRRRRVPPQAVRPCKRRLPRPPRRAAGAAGGQPSARQSARQAPEPWPRPPPRLWRATPVRPPPPRRRREGPGPVCIDLRRGPAAPRPAGFRPAHSRPDRAGSGPGIAHSRFALPLAVHPARDDGDPAAGGAPGGAGGRKGQEEPTSGGRAPRRAARHHRGHRLPGRAQEQHHHVAHHPLDPADDDQCLRRGGRHRAGDVDQPPSLGPALGVEPDHPGGPGGAAPGASGGGPGPGRSSARRLHGRPVLDGGRTVRCLGPARSDVHGAVSGLCERNGPQSPDVLGHHAS